MGVWEAMFLSLAAGGDCNEQDTSEKGCMWLVRVKDWAFVASSDDSRRPASIPAKS